MVSATTKKTLIISVSAIVGLTTLSTLAYLLIQDDRRAKHLRKIRAHQKQLGHKLSKVEASLQGLIDNDVRLAQVRVRTLRTYSIFPGDPHVHLPSLGLINEQDKIDLGDAIEETQDELIRERTQGYGEDSHKVRQAYKRLDFTVKSVNERLLRLLESLDAISPRELTDLGDGSGGLASANGPEMQAFEKIRKRKRADIAKIQKLMAQMDKIGATFKDRLIAVEVYEKEAEAAAIAAEEEEKEKKAKSEQEASANGHAHPHHEHVNGHAAESDKVKKVLSFAEVVSQHIEEPEVLAKTEDLEKMKDGVSFAEVVSHHTHEEHTNGAPTKTTTTTTTTTTTIRSSSSSSNSSSSSETVTVEENGHLEKVTEDVSFADIVSHSTHEVTSESESKEGQVLEIEDLEKVKAGVTFAEVASHHTEKEQKTEVEESGEGKAEVLEPTEDLEKMKHGVTFADVVVEEAPSTAEGKKEDEAVAAAH
ncbi:hypothetical protein BGZ58_000208 [Dissophora ornata]|nr:hypothetical protein BGZ58_000208 [Dissophora ornata]